MIFDKTITTMFIVPTLSINREKLRENMFINGYIKDGRRDVQYENAVYLLFKPENLDKFKEFLDEEYERTKSIIDDYDYEDGYVVIVYVLNSRLKSDFELIKQGKYSKTSPKFQDIFPKTFVSTDNPSEYSSKISLQYRIFNKTEDLREYWKEKLGIDLDDDMEVWGGFFEENEILNLEKLIENVQ
jgi:hypothetical protein